jgi:plastocyanin
MTRMSMTVAVLAACACLALTACGGSGSSSSTASTAASPPQASASGDAVSIKDFAYSPADLTVSKGTTIKFTNEDSTEHTATADGGGFDTGTIEKGQTKTVTLDTPGTFTYVCSFHPFMHGTVHVK